MLSAVFVFTPLALAPGLPMGTAGFWALGPAGASSFGCQAEPGLLLFKKQPVALG